MPTIYCPAKRERHRRRNQQPRRRSAIERRARPACLAFDLLGDAQGHQGRAELALRAIFGKIFPKERPLPLLPETIASNPRITDLAVLQAASTDGWFAISLGELPAPVAVAAPARRTLRK